ncbi:MAG: thioredoxin family protein [Planctomycetota bacterium]|nr:MAG: thioredoxin family protein [Planctomycetota bacterium]
MRHLACQACLLAAVVALNGCDIGVEGPASAESSTKPEEHRSTATVARGDLRFISGYGPGFAEASRRGKPMMLFFTATWCDYCHQMSDEAFTDPRVVQLASNFVCVLIDADAEPDVCRQFAVTGYPTVQFVSPRGVPLRREVGKKPGGELAIAMQDALRHVALRSGAESTTWW